MFEYPCTGYVEIEGFGKFLEEHIGEPRKNINELTEKLKETLDAEHATSVNSGSSANLIAALATKNLVGEESEVIISSFTFPTTASALLFSGLKPVVVDTKENHFVIDINKVEKSITEKTKAIFVTHFLGFISDLDKLLELKEKHNLLIIQDCCETFDAHHKGKKLSTYGDICTFGFYHPHHLSSYGGGLITTTHSDIAEYIESIVHWGRTCTCHISPENCKAPKGIGHQFHYSNVGLNLEISELNAAFGLFQLQNWKVMEEKRKKYYDIYYNSLKDSEKVIVLPREKGQCSPFVFPVIVKESSGLKLDQITNYLAGKNIETRNFMGNTITQQPAFTELTVSPYGLENSIKTSKNGFFLGIHQFLKEEQIKYVAEELKLILG